jgi:hypothetical protein
MVRSRLWLSMWTCLAVLGETATANAVCLDENFVSGYHLPLEKEVRSALAIVLGKVTRKKDLVEDPADPDGITATVYTVQVSRVVRGKVTPTIRIRSENDSGRFWMDVGKEYLLFLSKDVQHRLYFVDSCGNSGIASDRETVLRQVEERVP